jgi:hypothetical protein
MPESEPQPPAEITFRNGYAGMVEAFRARANERRIAITSSRLIPSSGIPTTRAKQSHAAISLPGDPWGCGRRTVFPLRDRAVRQVSRPRHRAAGRAKSSLFCESDFCSASIILECSTPRVPLLPQRPVKMGLNPSRHPVLAVAASDDCSINTLPWWELGTVS